MRQALERIKQILTMPTHSPFNWMAIINPNQMVRLILNHYQAEMLRQRNSRKVNSRIWMQHQLRNRRHSKRLQLNHWWICRCKTKRHQPKCRHNLTHRRRLLDLECRRRIICIHRIHGQCHGSQCHNQWAMINQGSLIHRWIFIYFFSSNKCIYLFNVEIKL